MSTPLKVFSSYAREDQTMLNQLKKHLRPLQWQGQITIWSDLDLNAGSEWEKERRQQLESADLILLLISPAFMNSDYCYHTEMARAIERYNQGDAHVIPILLRSTHWEGTPFAKFQLIPTDAKPVTRWKDRDDAFHDVIGHIKRFIATLRSEQIQNGATTDVSTQLSSQALGATSASLNQIASPLSILTVRPEAIKVLHSLTGHTGAVSRIALSTDGQLLASWSSDRTIKLWNPRTGQFLHTLTGSVDDMVLSTDGQLLASWSADHMIKLWNVQTSKLLHALKDYEHEVHYMALSADGQTLVSSGNLRGKYTIKLWNTQTSQLLHTFKGDEYGIHCTALSADGQLIASSGSFRRKQMIKMWDAQTGKLLRTFKDYKHNVHCLTLSVDGQILAGSGPNWTIKLWNAQTGKLLHIFSTLARYIALSVDGRMLASSGSDQAIKLWNVQTGELLCVLKGHTSEVYSMAFSADGRMLASGSDDGTIKVWGVKE